MQGSRWWTVPHNMYNVCIFVLHLLHKRTLMFVAIGILCTYKIQALLNREVLFFRIVSSEDPKLYSLPHQVNPWLKTQPTKTLPNSRPSPPVHLVLLLQLWHTYVLRSYLHLMKSGWRLSELLWFCRLQCWWPEYWAVSGSWSGLCQQV